MEKWAHVFMQSKQPAAFTASMSTKQNAKYVQERESTKRRVEKNVCWILAQLFRKLWDLVRSNIKEEPQNNEIAHT